ncbi:MAG TPA: serine/threonine-protein kinase [Terracidiphilus sp.]|nr:serine/threonine-protein kinase [Terracidiphilus sp.]
MNAAKTIGRYEIIGELGRGAMGSVFKARDPAVGRTVALKTILSAALGGMQSEQYRSRFLREAHAAGSLAHPGIVPVFDVGDHEGVPFLVMEFVDGRTLADPLKTGERFTLDRVCEIGVQIAEALGYAHRQGVIHRDIKPANILLTSREVYGAERPRITDFGIAKLTENEITNTGQLLGTPSFMPPEQFTGAPIDGRADLFSLGVILYCLATGEQPFPGETMTSVSYKVVNTEPVPPSKLNPAIPQSLEAVILKCLAKNPAERYQTGEEVAQDLAAVRTTSGSTVLRAVPPPRADVRDSEVTLRPNGQSIPPQAHAAAASNGAPKAAATAGSVPKPATAAARVLTKARIIWTGGIAAAAIVVVGAAVLTGNWLNARHRQQATGAPAPQITVPAAQAAPQSAAAAHVAQKDTQAKPSPSIPAKTVTPTSGPSAAAVAGPAPVTATPGATPAVSAPAATPDATAFNPKGLDPKTNAKLKVDLKHVPDGLAFTIEMNNKPYLKAVAGEKGSLDNLFVPPGIQEFSVTYVGTGQQKSSNIVSNEFKAKKRRTLHIELMGKTNAPAVVEGALNGKAQLFLSLK